MLTQIYETSSPNEARAISEIGIDHVGVLIGDGEFPREQPLTPAAEIAASITSPAKLSTLFLTARTSDPRTSHGRSLSSGQLAWTRRRRPTEMALT